MSGAIVLNFVGGTSFSLKEIHANTVVIQIAGKGEAQLADGTEVQYPLLNALIVKNLKIASSLFRSLVCNSKPVKIDLDGCPLSEGQEGLLATSVKTNEQLRALLLTRTTLSSEAAIALFEALKESQVEELDMEGAGLENRVLNALALFLKASGHIKKLTFSPGLKEENGDWPENFGTSLGENKSVREIAIKPPCRVVPTKEVQFCLYTQDVNLLLEGANENFSLVKMDIGPSVWHEADHLCDAAGWTRRWGRGSSEWEKIFERNKQLNRNLDSSPPSLRERRPSIRGGDRAAILTGLQTDVDDDK